MDNPRGRGWLRLEIPRGWVGGRVADWMGVDEREGAREGKRRLKMKNGKG
jgi:hypothetical protein